MSDSPRNHRLLVLTLLLGAIEALANPVAFAKPSYTAIDLGSLGGSGTGGGSINSSGEVVGYSFTPGGAQHAIKYEGGVMTDLGTLGGNFSFAMDVNDAGVIVGYSSLPGETPLHAFKYENGHMTDLGGLGGPQSWASTILSSGQIFGAASLPNSVEMLGCQFTDTGPTLLSLSGYSGGVSSINDSGLMVGGYAIGGVVHAFTLKGQQFTDLGAMQGFNSSAVSINNAGVIVGTMNVTNNMVSYSFKYEDGMMTTGLGNLGGPVSSASQINAYGIIVGTCTLPNGNPHAYVNENGIDHDLNSLVELPQVTLSYGRSINRHGQIVASGNDGHLYLLTPETGGKLINLSVRAPAGVDEASLIGGFVITGSGSKDVLVRVAGPALGAFGVAGLSDPTLSIHSSADAIVASNDDWDPALATTFAQVGAFLWTPGSKDAAVVVTLPAGAYTVVVGNGDPLGQQEALVEVYDVSMDSSELADVSCRTSENADTPIILGASMDRQGALLIRNAGPTLKDLGVSTAALDTRLEVFDGSDLMLANDNWDRSLAECFSDWGAFPFASRSKDAAAFVTAPPTQITVHCLSNGSGGVGLCELYSCH